MNDAADKLDPATDAPGSGAGSPQVKTPAGPAASSPSSPTALSHGAEDEGGGGEAKGDSEAETVVLPGKDDATTSPQRRAIKHEGNDDGKPSAKRASDGAGEKAKDTPDRDADSKSKKTPKDHTATSSNLSSTRSSPAPDARVASRAGSESVASKTKSHPDSDSVSRTSQSRKRKMASEDGDEKNHKRRQKRDGSLESAANGASGDRDRRDKTKPSVPRSESPQPRTRNRAQSIKGSGAGTSQQPRRKKPPPLSVSSRNKNNEDDSSEGSASPHSGTPHLRRLVSGDATATSPAKMPPHKKLRDKSGRTFLARVCDSEDPEIVRARLLERPEDLDIADYAGNTPLQIASLCGRHEIVKILLEAGCKTDCKNVDQDTPLIDAVENGHLEVIKLLLDAGMSPHQTNAKGEELMDLLDPDADDYVEIKRVLNKTRDSRRRASDDHQAPHTGKESATNHSPRDSNMNSPPPLASATSRRRTARSEATRNDLLWVNPTAQNLREKARVGDDTAVDHILNMNPRVADIDSVLAAARGSHEVSLSLILAIGRPPADPDPLPGERPGQATPMLAAIGRGNLRVIELLLEQPDFNPSRRLYQNKTYHELAKDRRGPGWEDEYKLLKSTYDKFKGRSSKDTSPSTSKKIKSEPAGSSSQERTKSKAEAKEALERKKSSVDGRRSQSRTEERHESPERSRQHTKKHLRVPSKPSSREASIAVSDREASPLRKPSEKKSRRSLSDPEGPDAEVQKPRKRLISKRDLNEGDHQRRTSMVSVGSASSQDRTKRPARDQPVQKEKLKREEKRDDVKHEEGREASKLSKVESTKKRPRPDTASPDGEKRDAASLDAAKKAKRLRVDADGKSKKKSDTDGSSTRHKSPEKDTVKLASKEKGTKSATNSSRKTSPAPAESTKIKEEPDMSSSQLQKEAQEAAEAEKERKEQARKDAEKAKREREEAEKAKREREEAEARAAEQLRREEAERKLKAEQEEAERKAKAEKEEAERKAREEEEARLEKKRQEEEAARKQAERERLRKEQEELQARRRKEQEEKERLAREKKQQEEERRRREALPPALRMAAELTPEQAKLPHEVRHWLPLYTAESQQLEVQCDEPSKQERWITNIQAAPILGVTDLDLSQYTAWTKRPATDAQRFALWRILRRKLARYEVPELGMADHHEEFRLDAEAREKYDALKSVFWIRLSDLQDIVPRYPHLSGIDLKTCAMAIRPAPTSTDKTNGTPLANGLPARGLPNGFH